uniref:Uncharacterized protein n=1 Tax=Steinernema glaseri TaxID=37863 RepID=A0A1I7Z0K0_9BILA
MPLQAEVTERRRLKNTAKGEAPRTVFGRRCPSKERRRRVHVIRLQTRTFRTVSVGKSPAGAKFAAKEHRTSGDGASAAGEGELAEMTKSDYGRKDKKFRRSLSGESGITRCFAFFGGEAPQKAHSSPAPPTGTVAAAFQNSALCVHFRAAADAYQRVISAKDDPDPGQTRPIDATYFFFLLERATLGTSEGA